MMNMMMNYNIEGALNSGMRSGSKGIILRLFGRKK